MGKGTIYLYFENKRELFLAMLRSIAQAHMAAIRETLAAEGAYNSDWSVSFWLLRPLRSKRVIAFNVYMSALYGVNRAFQDGGDQIVA